MRSHLRFLSKKSEEQLVNKLTLTVAIIEPIFAIPQVIEIYQNKSATDISLASWSFWLLSSLVWLAYARIRRDWVLGVSSALWVVANSLIVLGIFLYD